MIPIPMIPRLLNLQGMIDIAASLLILGLVLVKASEARHWRKQSGRYEQLYVAGQGAMAQTVANYRAAAETARLADAANATRVAAAQRSISERTTNDFEARLADARARALRLQLEPRAAAAAYGSGRTAAVPAAGAAPRAAGGAAAEIRLPDAAKSLSLDERLVATEQAIQLDELIKWVKAQAAVDSTPEPGRAR